MGEEGADGCRSKDFASGARTFFVSTTGSMTANPACAVLTLQAQPQDRREKGEEDMTERFEAENPEDDCETDDDFMTEEEPAHIGGFRTDDGNRVPGMTWTSGMIEADISSGQALPRRHGM